MIWDLDLKMSICSSTCKIVIECETTLLKLRFLTIKSTFV